LIAIPPARRPHHPAVAAAYDKHSRAAELARLEHGLFIKPALRVPFGEFIDTPLVLQERVDIYRRLIVIKFRELVIVIASRDSS
jgi:hypothetical protein